MVHIVPKSSLISAIITESLPFAFLCALLTSFNHSMFCFSAGNQPYKHFHAAAIDAATRTGCPDSNKLEFLAALTSIREQTFKKTTVLSAFRQTGLIPFNPEIVLSKLSKPETEPSRPGIPTPNTSPSNQAEAYHLVTRHTYRHRRASSSPSYHPVTQMESESALDCSPRRVQPYFSRETSQLYSWESCPSTEWSSGDRRPDTHRSR